MWEQKCKEIRKRIEGAGRDVYGVHVIAVARGDEDVPVLLAGIAQEDLCEDIRYVETKVEPDDKVGSPVHEVSLRHRGKDLEVLEENRKLDYEGDEAV